jgi:hypothetical protein
VTPGELRDTVYPYCKSTGRTRPRELGHRTPRYCQCPDGTGRWVPHYPFVPSETEFDKDHPRNINGDSYGSYPAGENVWNKKYAGRSMFPGTNSGRYTLRILSTHQTRSNGCLTRYPRRPLSLATTGTTSERARRRPQSGSTVTHESFTIHRWFVFRGWCQTWATP